MAKMRKPYMSGRIFLVALFSISAAIMLSCETEPPKPDTPVFSDVEMLEVSEFGGEYLFENLPSYVKYIQVLIFASANTPVINDNTKIIQNISSMKGGNRTGLSGISRSEVSSFYDYDEDTGDFDSGTAMSPALSADDWFIVLGFDENYNLTHASPLYRESNL